MEIRPLNKIAAEILSVWAIPTRKGLIPPYMIYAKPYVEAMLQLRSVKDMYGVDTADDIVLRFLVNAGSWRGEAATRIKRELNKALESVK